MFTDLLIIYFQYQTPDLGGLAKTNEVVEAIIEDIKPKALAWLVQLFSHTLLHLAHGFDGSPS